MENITVDIIIEYTAFGVGDDKCWSGGLGCVWNKFYLHFYRKDTKVRLGKKRCVWEAKPPPQNGGLGGEVPQLRIDISGRFKVGEDLVMCPPRHGYECVCVHTCINIDINVLCVCVYMLHIYKIILTLNRRRDVLNVTQKRLPYAERTFKTSPKR